MSKKVVLSVAAHGDDAEFLAGGTLAKLAAEGNDLYLAIATNNDRGSFRLSQAELKACAHPEAEASMEALGAKGVFMLDYVDGDLCDERPIVLRGKVMELIRRVKADIVFCWDPFAPYEDHPDHRAIAWATSDAVSFAHFPLYHPEHPYKPHRVSEVYWYSKAGWETNRIVDISAHMDTKLDALYSYHCQMVLTIDEFIMEARAAGVPEEKLTQFDPLQFKPLIDKGMRARNAKIGAEINAAYGEAFRYVSVEVPAALRD